jgi:hypothetical protein
MSDLIMLTNESGSSVGIRYIPQTKQVSVHDVIRLVTEKGAQYSSITIHRMDDDLKTQLSYHKFLSARKETPVASIPLMAKIIRTLPGHNHEKREQIIKQLCDEVGISKTTWLPKSTMEFIYIASTDVLKEQNLFKIGKTKNLKQRMRALGTGHTGCFKIHFVHECQNARQLELYIHKSLKNWRVATNREFFHMDLNEVIFRVMDLIGDYNFAHPTEMLTLTPSD